MFDRKIIHDLSKNPSTKVGRRNKADPTQDPPIALSSVGVLAEHALFETNASGTTLKALSPEACQFICINGIAVKDVNPV